MRAGAEPGGDGQSPARAFASLQAAADVTEPGDTVYIMNGTYSDEGAFSNQGPLNITRSGTAEAPIRYTAFPAHRPVITVSLNGWNGIRVTSAAYIIIDHLRLIGNAAALTYEDAYAAQDLGKPTFNANGIFVGKQPGNTGEGSHHVWVTDNLVRHWPGGGVAASSTDYLVVRRNVVHSNAWWAVYANSGITTLTPFNADQHDGYRNFITENVTYRNESYIPWVRTGAISDGNGIIVDSTITSEPAYTGRTYVANNVSFDNGGSGIHAYRSGNVDMVNNTVFANSRSPALDYANLHANSCEDTNLLNNVIYTSAGEPTNLDFRNVNVRYDYNIYFGGLEPVVVGPNDIIADPQLVNPDTDPADADFRLRAGSPAISTGTPDLAPSIDHNGDPRPADQPIDRGAYRYSPAND